MTSFDPAGIGHVLCLSAHADDVEIGAGGTLLRLASELGPAFTVVVATGDPVRSAEAETSIAALLGQGAETVCLGFEDGFLPYRDPGRFKDALAAAVGFRPDLVLAPSLEDSHQDHRLVGEVAWQLFRGATILEYEIAKWEADRPRTTFYVGLSEAQAERKIAHLMEHFPSQLGKPWYRPGVFRAVLELRGIEAGAPSGLAEGFVARKLTW